MIGCNANTSNHETSIGRVATTGDTGQQRQCARGLHSGELHRFIEAMLLAVEGIKVTQLLVCHIKPTLLFFSGLQHTSDANTHTHILMHNGFCLWQMARQSKAVFVNTIEQCSHIVKLFFAFNVRQIDFCQAAGFFISQALFCTWVVPLHFRVWIFCLTQASNLT